MNINIYSVKDTKAQSYGPPWAQNNHVVAIRVTTQEVNRPDPGNMLFTNPDDFELHHIATFNTDTGEIQTPDSPLIANLVTLKKE